MGIDILLLSYLALRGGLHIIDEAVVPSEELIFDLVDNLLLDSLRTENFRFAAFSSERGCKLHSVFRLV